MGNPQPLTPGQLQLIAKSRVEAFKMLTLPDPELNKRLVQQLKNIRPDMFIVARIFYSPGHREKTRFSAQDFVNTVFIGVKAAFEAGVRYFEVHNEPNLETEGMGWNWSGGAEFGNWLMQTLTLLRQDFRDARFGYPGLSPQDNVPAFIESSAPAVGQCDWIGAHAYWQDLNHPSFPITGEEAGMYWRRFRNRFPDKLLMITEFSNNNGSIDPVEKGRQYSEYYRLLRNERNVGAAFSFALSWPGQDVNREGWEADGRETGIAGEVGAKIAQAGFLA
jgi:hypothetical protein